MNCVIEFQIVGTNFCVNFLSIALLDVCKQNDLISHLNIQLKTVIPEDLTTSTIVIGMIDAQEVEVVKEAPRIASSIVNVRAKVVISMLRTTNVKIEKSKPTTNQTMSSQTKL